MPDDDKTRPFAGPGAHGEVGEETVRKGSGTASLSRGENFGRYLILHQLGAGGMGAVFAAHDPVLDRKVALKILHEKVASQDSEQRLRREAQAMARLNHPNVVTVHDAGTHEGRPFVAMEFVEGGDLADWLQAEPRDWREIVAMFTAAGEGLAAAHAADLVHRDFKPSNVMIGNDRRVRVTDFGLARSAESRDWDKLKTVNLPSPGEQPAGTSTSPLDTPLTMEGWLLGTPSFMAPEQALEHRADQKSDQYSFCVALFIALFGRHPLGNFKTITEYLALVADREAHVPPAGHSVPNRVLTAILRGLSRSPVERFPDMKSLLDELRFDPRQRRQRWLRAGFGTVALAAVCTGAIFYTSHRRQVCLGGEDRVTAVWGQERRSELEGRFFEVAGLTGRTAADAVTQRLDEYALNWAKTHRETCEATRIRGEHSEVLLDRQMGCLRRRLYEVDSLIELLINGNHDLVVSALDAVVGLQSPTVCADTVSLVGLLPLPDDEEIRSEIETSEKELAFAEADLLAGNYQACLERLKELAAVARKLDYAPLLAETLVAKGYIEAEIGLADDADISLREALAAAERGRDDKAGTMAASNLMWVTAYLQDQFDESDRWYDFAEAKVARLEGDERLAADLYDTRTGVLISAGRYSEAIEMQEKALDLLNRVHGPESLEVAMAMTSMGNALSAIGEYESAAEYYSRSLELKRRLVRSDHPTVAATMVNLSQAYAGLADYERTVELASQALVIQENVFGTEDAQLAVVLNNLAYGLEGLGQFEEARAIHQRSMDVVIKASGPDDPQLAYSWLNLASLENQSGDFEAALAASKRAGEILIASLGTEHPIYAYAANNIGLFLIKTGRPADAVLHLEKALAIRTSGVSDPLAVAQTRFSLGRALWGAGQRDKGIRYVRQAEQEFELLNERAEEDLIFLREWLAKH